MLDQQDAHTPDSGESSDKSSQLIRFASIESRCRFVEEKDRWIDTDSSSNSHEAPDAMGKITRACLKIRLETKLLRNVAGFRSEFAALGAHEPS